MIHMKYKVFFNSVPSKVLNADREIYKPGTAHVVSCKLYVLDRFYESINFYRQHPTMGN